MSFYTATMAAICVGWCTGVLAQQPTADTDNQIRFLLGRIDATIATTNPAPLNELSQHLIQADSLAANASPAGRQLLADFPASLRRHGEDAQAKGEEVKSINYTVFADYAEQVIEKALQQPAVRQALVQPIIARPSPPTTEPIQQPPTPQPVKVQPVIARPTPPPATPAPSPTPPPPPEQALVDRGDEMLRLGQISAARMFFERAAASGLAIAALKLGDTYDADFLQSRKLLGIQPEPAMAAKWYRKAQEMGEVRAHERLRVLQQQHKLANLED